MSVMLGFDFFGDAVLRHSPDCSGKPFAAKLYFFLAKKSDQRKLLFWLRKKQWSKKA
jgi:hypothetical protein